MKPKLTLRLLCACIALLLLSSCNSPNEQRKTKSSPSESTRVAKEQVPTWSSQDMQFFLHGSMSTEVVPETVLRAFIRTYPDLFPSNNLSNFGFIPDAKFGWPIGFSRDKVPHLGGLSAVGVNCASCHVGEIPPDGGGAS